MSARETYSVVTGVVGHLMLRLLFAWVSIGGYPAGPIQRLVLRTLFGWVVQPLRVLLWMAQSIGGYKQGFGWYRILMSRGPRRSVAEV